MPLDEIRRGGRTQSVVLKSMETVVYVKCNRSGNNFGRGIHGLINVF